MKEQSTKIYGAKISNKNTGKTFEVWYDKLEDREKFIDSLGRSAFELIELLGEQVEFNFDVRI